MVLSIISLRIDIEFPILLKKTGTDSICAETGVIKIAKYCRIVRFLHGFEVVTLLPVTEFTGMAAFALLVADKCIVFWCRSLYLCVLWLAILNRGNANKDEDNYKN